MSMRKAGWINIYKTRTGRIVPGTSIYDTKDIALDTARHKKNLLLTIFVCFQYEDRPWRPTEEK